VLGHDGEQIAEEGAVPGGQVARDLVGRRGLGDRPVGLAQPRMAAVLLRPGGLV